MYNWHKTSYSKKLQKSLFDAIYLPNSYVSLQSEDHCSVQNTARKNLKYARNETILKIGHLAKAIAHAKAIAFAKWSVWVKN